MVGWVVNWGVNWVVNWVVDWVVGWVVNWGVNWVVNWVVDWVVDFGVVDFGVVDFGVVVGEVNESFGVIITWVLGFGEADPISAELAGRLIFLSINTGLIGVDGICFSVKYAGRRSEDDDDDNSCSHVFLSTAKAIAFLLHGTSPHSGAA